MVLTKIRWRINDSRIGYRVRGGGIVKNRQQVRTAPNVGIRIRYLPHRVKKRSALKKHVDLVGRIEANHVRPT